MFGRFRACDLGYVDELAAARARNPYYREYPPGVANEPVDRPIVFGLLDFFAYVLAIYPLAAAHQACFFLWVVTIPFGFLSTVMPVGPISAYYWRYLRPNPDKLAIQDLESTRQQLITRLNALKELLVESFSIEKELNKELPNAGELRFAFETHIRQTRETREQLRREIQRVEEKIATMQQAISNDFQTRKL
jgi:hypothetical protein